ncbi:DNA primase family protein [Paracoccus sp. SJTW-4]|uniref:DNA primase family protein n=1 Tax=Paracoccus sp. SJTW-4 TaxID=3078428 RepID=UPI0039ECFFAE
MNTAPRSAQFASNSPGGDPFAYPMATGRTLRGAAIGTITYAELADLAFDDPPRCVPKADAGWFIPSALGGADARIHAAQRDRGEFGALVLDIDEGGHSLDRIGKALGEALGGDATALIYSTKSATAADPRWRIVVPLQEPLAGADYADTTEALCERIAAVSGGAVAPDRAVCRPGQISFLPNLPDAPEDGSAPFYQRREIGPEEVRALVLDGGHPIIRIREERRAVAKAASDGAAVERQRRRQEREADPRTSLIERFNRAHVLTDLLQRYGYVNRNDGGQGWGELWRSPHQQSGSYATRVFEDESDGSEYWVSLSDSDRRAGLGSGSASGRWGDAFDLFVHYAHGGDENVALAAWRGECDNARNRAAAEAVLRKRGAAAGGEATDDAAEVERLAALGAVESDDASLAAGWLKDEGARLVLADDGRWRRFDGGHWHRLDDDGVRAALSRWLCAVADVKTAAAEAALEEGESDLKAFGKVRLLRTRLRSTAQLEAVFRQARAVAVRAPADSFDADPYLLGVTGGMVVDLRTGEAREGRPEDRVSLSTAVAPSPPGVGPERWLRFIDQIADGREDWAVFLQRLAGYALTGSTDAQSIFFLYGHGSNGKSVLREVLRGVVGDGYGRTASSEVFLRSGGTQHPTGLANLAGARLALVSELPQGRVWNDELLKDITGGEAISARRMYGDPFSFTPQATVIVTGNHRPSFTSADEAMARRMVLVELRRRFGPQEIDPGLAGKLLAEGPAVLRWMIEGAAAWIAAGGGREGLAIPPDVLAAGRQYAEEEDILRQFLTDRQLANPGSWAAGGFIASDALYREFRRWAEDNGHRQWTKTTFGKQLTAGAERYGLAPKRTRAQRGYEIERLLIDDEERASALDRIAGGVGRLTVVGGRDGGHASRE